uniref:hypothetical protein n=1 Tax=uncultured Acidovorax sp. TaxID=158751 RepID=UPI001B3097FA
PAQHARRAASTDPPRLPQGMQRSPLSAFRSQSNYFEYQNSQLKTQWFLIEHHRRTVHPIDEPNPSGDSPNPE